METYICLLRGINVSGQKLIKMEKLKGCFEKLEFTKVVTYIQSGNVVFQAQKADDAKLEAKIKSGILKDFGFDVPVIVRTHAEMKKVIAKNPYLKTKGVDLKKLYVTFLATKPSKTQLKVLSDNEKLNSTPDVYTVQGREIFLYLASGYGTTVLSNMAFEKLLKIEATTRNWNTVSKLTDMSAKAQV